MRVAILGGGRIGRYIAHDVLAHGHDVVIIERHVARVESLVAETGVLVIEGEMTDLRYLEQARIDEADVIIATTHEDDVNLVACRLALTAFSVGRAISRVNDPRNVDLFRKVGIEPVSSTKLISDLIEAEFAVGELVRLTSLRGGRVGVLELRIPEGDAAPPPRRVETLGVPDGAILVAVFRGEETIVPQGSTEVRPGDEVVAIAPAELEARLAAALLGTG